jgi:GNAT superfamily N-acetyltransferase
MKPDTTNKGTRNNKKLSLDGHDICEIKEVDVDSADALKLLDELSQTLEAITGNSGKGSFDTSDVKVFGSLFAVAYSTKGETLGCGAIRPMEDGIAELKRMYARYKGAGIGSNILSYLETNAKLLGYSALRLETRLINTNAVSFYEASGYKRIPNYGKYAGRTEAVCFEKLLSVADF